MGLSHPGYSLCLNLSNGVFTCFPLRLLMPQRCPFGCLLCPHFASHGCPVALWRREAPKCSRMDWPWLSGGESCSAPCCSADADQTCPSCCLGETKLLAMTFLGVILFPCSKLLVIYFFFFQLNSKELGALPHPQKQNPWEVQQKAKPLSGSHWHPDITRAPCPLLGGMLLICRDEAIKEEGALGLPQALPAGMWMGYSQGRRCC